MTASDIPSSAPRLKAPPAERIGVLRWLRQNLFSNIPNTILTVAAVGFLYLTLPDLIDWGLINSVWSTDDPGVCRKATGACWAVIGEKHRVILFGTYPYDEQWRATLCVVIIIAMAAASAFRKLWSWWLGVAWLIAVAACFALMLGGVFGLSEIKTSQWGGLPLTMIFFVGTVVGGLPMAVILALGRRSNMPAVKAVCVAIIEIIRGVPLITVLFMTSLMLPLFFPDGFNMDKVLRAGVGMTIFFGAMSAETVRGGLQAIPKGQLEAADALGLGYWQTTIKIVLPQALRIVIPALMGDIIRAFKNTSLVLIIGVFDILGATKAALSEPLWMNFYKEAYLFIALLYFVFCYSMSKYSQDVERRLSAGRNF